MSHVLTGTIHGNTIVLDGPPALPDGESVEIVIRSNTQRGSVSLTEVAEDARPEWWTDEDDRILEEIYQSRKLSNRPIPE